jgi:hypothetical protein
MQFNYSCSQKIIIQLSILQPMYIGINFTDCLIYRKKHTSHLYLPFSGKSNGSPAGVDAKARVPAKNGIKQSDL